MYSYNVKNLYKVSAEDAGNELERIREKYGTLLPKDVVEESKSEDSVLHSIFEWDNKKAADSWRISQAQALIRNVVVTIEHEEVVCKVRAFVNSRESASDERSYIPINVAMNNDVAYADMLATCKRDMQNFINKYQVLSETRGIIKEMLKVMVK